MALLNALGPGAPGGARGQARRWRAGAPGIEEGRPLHVPTGNRPQEAVVARKSLLRHRGSRQEPAGPEAWP